MHALSQTEVHKYRTTFTETDRDLSALFKILSDINRYRIFVLLMGSARISMGNLAKILNISVPLTSQHVKIMVQAGLLQKQRNGKRIYPKLDHENPLVKIISRTLTHV